MQRIITILAAASLLQGCAISTAINTASYLATDKTLTDHTLTQVTGADCNSSHPFKDKYYCEVRDVGVTYNRNGF